MKLVTVEQMRKIEAEANARGFTYEQMMQNAGKSLAEAVINLSDLVENRTVIGLVGSGNNGGDTLVALRWLAEAGWNATAYLLRPRDEADPYLAELIHSGGEFLSLEQDKSYKRMDALLHTSSVLLDGVLGTGFVLPLKPEVAKPLNRVRKFLEEHSKELFVVAVDCPSGVDCTTGEAAPEAIPADITICMAAIKTGLLKFPAFTLAGELAVAAIGLEMESTDSVATREEVATRLPERPLDAHKNDFGKGIVVAGSLNYTGAAMLSGKAAYRVGIGWVTLAVPAPLHMPLAGQFPEATWLLLPHEMGVIAEAATDILSTNLSKYQAALLGPGWGEEDTTLRFLTRLLEGSQVHGKGKIGFNRQQPAKAEQKKEGALPALVIDADGLKLLAKIPNWQTMLPKNSILTPHPGEMSALTGESVEAIQKDRIETARRYAVEWGQVVILKGACTVIASPKGLVEVIPVATPALAHAGTGDVLAGMVLGYLAQGLEPMAAAVTAAFIHAQAGIGAGEMLGSTASVLASDVVDAIPDVLGTFE